MCSAAGMIIARDPSLSRPLASAWPNIEAVSHVGRLLSRLCSRRHVYPPTFRHFLPFVSFKNVVSSEMPAVLSPSVPLTATRRLLGRRMSPALSKWPLRCPQKRPGTMAGDSVSGHGNKNPLSPSLRPVCPPFPSTSDWNANGSQLGVLDPDRRGANL